MNSETVDCNLVWSNTVQRIFFIVSSSYQLFPTEAFEYPRFLPLLPSLPPLSSANSISFLFDYQYGTVLYVSFHIISYCTIQFYIILRHIVSYHIIHYDSIMQNTVSYRTVLYHAVLCKIEYNVKVYHNISRLFYDITIYSIYFIFSGKVQREG